MNFSPDHPAVWKWPPIKVSFIPSVFSAKAEIEDKINPGGDFLNISWCPVPAGGECSFMFMERNESVCSIVVHLFNSLVITSRLE